MLVKPEIFVGLYVCACLFLQASVCWTHKSACTQYICSKYMSGCFICSKVPCSPLMKLLLYKHTHALICTPYTHKTQRPSKWGRPLRGEDSFLGKWEPAGLDKHTHTNQTTSCAWTQHFPALFIYSIHSPSLLYLFSLSCPQLLGFTFPFDADTFLCISGIILWIHSHFYGWTFIQSVQ